MNLPVLIFADMLDGDGNPAAFKRLYNVSMLERHVRNFASLGAAKVTVVTDSDSSRDAVRNHLDGLDSSWFESVAPVTVVDGADVPALVAQWNSIAVLTLDAHHLYDQRALDAIVAAGDDTMLIDVDGSTGVPRSETCHLAILKRITILDLCETWEGCGSFWSELAMLRKNAHCQSLNIRNIDPYIINLRRSIPPYWLPVKTREDQREGENRLIDAAQKGTLDFPARYLHPPFENWMTRQVARFPSISPNVITTVTNIIAFITTALLSIGDLGVGLLLAAFVGVLDGVDGKLARTTVRCTQFGDRYEHILDNVYEISWYLALGWAFSEGGANSGPILLSGLMVLFYIVDRAITGGFKHLRRIELFDYSPIDRVFRQIGSRRNVNVLMMIAGVILNSPLTAFEFMIAWMACTALFHGVRGGWILLLSSRSDRVAEPAGGTGA